MMSQAQGGGHTRGKDDAGVGGVDEVEVENGPHAVCAGYVCIYGPWRPQDSVATVPVLGYSRAP
jgi:hypothetical protein